MRWLWLILLIVGCEVQKAPQPSPFYGQSKSAPSPYYESPKPKPAPSPGPGMDTPSIRVEAPASVVLALHQWLGDGNTVTLKQPHTIKHADLTLNVPADASLSYTLTDENGKVIFNNPKPTITAKVFGFSVSPTINQIDLKADNTGTIEVQTGPFKKKQVFSLGWIDDVQESSGAAGTITSEPVQVPDPVQVPTAGVYRPTVYCWSSVNCGPCAAAKAALASASPMSLPFDHLWDIGNAPAGLGRQAGGVPQFAWRGADGRNYRLTGWYSLKHLTDEVAKTIKSPTTTAPKTSARAGRPHISVMATWTNRWYEQVNGRNVNTSAQHLMRDHGISAEELRPYMHNPDALNRIHGWSHDHTGR